MMGRFTRDGRRLTAIAAAGLVALALGACGDSTDDSSTATGGGAGTAASTAGATTAAAGGDQQKAVKVGVDYVGGTAGAADTAKKPIRIGWINQDESPAGNAAENTDSVKAAFDFINKDLGGIGGAPLELVQCTVGASEQQGKQCAAQFLNDDSIQAVMVGYVIIGAGSFMATIAPGGTAPKPVIGFGPSSPKDGSLKNVYFTTGGFLTSAIHPIFMRDYLQAKTVSSLWSDAPGLTPFITSSNQTFKDAGLDVTVGKIPATGTDVVAPIVASGAKDTDAMILNLDDTSQCIAVAQGLQQLGLEDKPTVGYAACLGPQAKDELGDYPKWYYYRSALSPNVPDPSGQVDAFRYAVDTYTPEDKREATIQGAYTADVFGAAMVATKWLNALGPDAITADGFAKQAAAWTGPMFMGYPEPKFGQAPFPGIASLAEKYYKYDGDDKWEDATDGKWLVAPAS